MASYMALHKYGSPHQEPLRDPMLYDTVLTREGLRQVQQLAPQVSSLEPRPEVVLTSPLTRCLQTATAACQLLLATHPQPDSSGGSSSSSSTTSGSAQVPLEAEPLLRERLTLSSEVGRSPLELRADFPGVSFPEDMPEVWWHTGGPGADPRAVVLEPQGVYDARLQALRLLLASRPERCLLVVAHWGVIRSLTGRELQPGELATAELEA